MTLRPRTARASIRVTIAISLLLAAAHAATAGSPTAIPQTTAGAAAPCQVICVIGKNVCQVDSPLTPLVNQIACLIGGVLVFIDSEIPLGT